MSDLERFTQAQEANGSFDEALRELRDGRKRTHWIWWVFPQLRGLGRSTTSWTYGIADAAEARAYLHHEILGPRLHQAVAALLAHAGKGVEVVVGADAVKVRSCLTLFELVDPDDEIFGRALESLFHGARDPVTVARITAS